MCSECQEKGITPGDIINEPTRDFTHLYTCCWCGYKGDERSFIETEPHVEKCESGWRVLPLVPIFVMCMSSKATLELYNS